MILCPVPERKNIMSKDPLLVTVTRGGYVESTHLVDVVVADEAGDVVQSFGKQDDEIFPRSANKALQALPLVESGAADAFGFDEAHLALACSSHNGEHVHVENATAMLRLAGLDQTCLECGAQLPKRAEDQAEMVRAGIPVGAIHNNCSGKHAGFVAFAKYAGFPVSDYIQLKHPVQREIASVLTDVTAFPHTEENHGIDGCSIPTYRMPLLSLAVAFAKFGVGNDPSQSRSKAMIKLRDACMKHPYMVAGKDRVCTQVMEALPGRAFVKVGAEGVYTACLPEKGLGIAMKARDGNFRAVEVAVTDVIRKHLVLDDAELARLDPLSRPLLKNWNGIEVGSIRVTSPS